MNIRETMEQWERQNLSPYASLSSETLGRDREEPLCDIRPAYQRDPAQQVIPAPERQDPGFPRSGRGPLPDETDPYVRGIPDRENDRKGTPDE